MELVKHFMKKRNRIGEYELEWVELELDVHPKAAAKMERLKKTFTRTVCIYCGGPLKNGFSISKLSEKTGYPIEDHEVNSIYEANKITG